jgi:putative nucleotidyltransferase with HDIG domain
MINRDKILAKDLQIGMYVGKLDRPWLETPFPFQGFFIRSHCEIKELKNLCRYVYIDAKKGSTPYKQCEIAKPSPLLVDENKKHKNRLKASKFSYTHVNIGKYKGNQTPFNKEIKKAKALMTDLSFAMDNINFTLRTGQKLDSSKISNITKKVVKSIIRNPNSLISLSRLKDKGGYTYNHSMRCCVLATAFGRYLGLSEEELLILATGALFADIGKSKIPRKLLNSSSKLSVSEKLLLNSHVELGVELLANNDEFEHEILVIVETHHERHNGQGYPYKLVGEEIPLLGQMVGMVDVFDAITNEKSYGQHMNTAEAMDWLYTQKDVLFSPQLVDDFIQAIGLYPAGTKVQLSDDSKAIVISQNPEKRLRPVVYLIEDGKQKKLKKYKKIDLSKKSIFSHQPKPMIAKAIL